MRNKKHMNTITLLLIWSFISGWKVSADDRFYCIPKHLMISGDPLCNIECTVDTRLSLTGHYLFFDFIQVDFAAPVGYQEPEKQSKNETDPHSPAEVGV